MMSGQVIKKMPQPVRPGGKLMRLRCRLRPLFEGYLVNDQIAERDADVVFECRGGSAKAHKVILSIVCKFFADIFKDQKPGKVSVVIVPDIPVSIMRLILKLCYKETVKLTMNAMKDIGNYLSLFGLAWDQFNFTEEGEEVGATGMSLANAQSSSNVVLTATSSPSPTKSQGLVQQKNIIYRSAGGRLIPAPGSTLPKDPKVNGGPTYVLDTGNPEDLGFRVQTAPAKPSPRPILPKPAGFVQAGVKRPAVGGPPVLQRMGPSNNNNSVHLEQPEEGSGRIEVDIDNDQPEEGRTNTSPEAQKSIKQWIASVGRDSNPPKLTKPPTLKRRVTPGAAFAGTKVTRMQCTVCNAVFADRTKWKWHEDRHVGINLYKCTHCEHIFSTSRQVYQHEMMEHGIIGTEDQEEVDEEEEDNEEPNDAPLLGHLPVGEEKHRVTVVKTMYGSHYRRLPASKSTALKKKIAAVRKQYKSPSHEKLHHNFASRNSAIGIGTHEGEHLIETRKLKQLHWLYVCSKCDNCADSSAKAIAHYKVCYGEDGAKFEETVVKYRQGFYGKCKCPLCPRRYTSLGGFLIHCGHMHQDYRKTFSHINSEDMLMCVNCREKYEDPEAFHNHMGEDFTCHRPSRDDIPLDPNSVEGRQRPNSRLLGSNPRSARLQNRLAAVTACFEDDPVDESNFNPVTCPICGESETPFIAEHLRTVHPELDISVERTAENSFRCTACGITFAVWDLLAHNISCTGSKNFNYVAERKTAALSPQKPAPVKSIPIEYPPGIGTSPIEKMERTDLLSIDVLREAFACGVCKKEGRKMNIVAECLRTHGVYRCAICFNSYLSRENASKHLKKCHSTNSGKAVCPICRIVRSNAGQLTSHMYSSHWLPVLREHEVDMRANKLMNQLQESAGEEGHNSIKNESNLNNSEVSAQDESMEDEVDPSLHVAAVLNEEEPAHDDEKEGQAKDSTNPSNNTLLNDSTETTNTLEEATA